MIVIIIIKKMKITICTKKTENKKYVCKNKKKKNENKN